MCFPNYSESPPAQNESYARLENLFDSRAQHLCAHPLLTVLSNEMVNCCCADCETYFVLGVEGDIFDDEPLCYDCWAARPPAEGSPQSRQWFR